MSASSNVIWRGLRRVLQALRVVSPRPAETAPAGLRLVDDAAPTRLTATIEIVALIDEIREPVSEPAMTDPAMAEPILTPVAAAPRHVSMPRPLARQLAYTASRNVPKGRKAHPAPVPAIAGKRKISAVKAKPIVHNAVKKAPKRRHVWLCNQARVVRPVGLNVVSLNTNRTRTVHKPGTQKTIRLLKLAA